MRDTQQIPPANFRRSPGSLGSVSDEDELFDDPLVDNNNMGDSEQQILNSMDNQTYSAFKYYIWVIRSKNLPDKNSTKKLSQVLKRTKFESYRHIFRTHCTTKQSAVKQPESKNFKKRTHYSARYPQ